MAGSLRITGGTLVRRRFNVPNDADKGLVRPTTDRAREAIFSALKLYLPGVDVLDIFAGSGACSFESLSRGAKSALLVEKSRDTAKCILENIKSLGLENDCQLVVKDATLFVKADTNKKYDIIFVDPPYDLKLEVEFWQNLQKFLHVDSIVIFRCKKK
ncbi:MAG: 16S rRNA (guanine(966)-N(2))-methyltransferase RsmD, partial [bacterium]|nr:16S rRNA (guanine(966)-N(2))-methyltransferase RsmD [bacterium]